MSRKVTIFDVAEKAGVAISSVSAALNNGTGVSAATRARIVAAAVELGFVPSLRGRSLSSKRAYAIGLVVHREPDVLELDPFFGAFIAGIENAIDARGYALVLQISSDAESSQARYTRLASDARVDGVVLNDLTVDDRRPDLLRDLRMPAVGVNADSGFPFPVVRQDHRAGIQEMVKYLVGQGHRRFGHVAGPSDFVHAAARRLAWEEELAAVGLPAGTMADGGFSFQGGVASARRLLSAEERPTAVFCANDLSAIGFMTEARQMGLDVPGDVSVTGYDGIQLGEYFHPELTTIRTAPRLLGASAGRLLLDLIAGRDVVDEDIPAAVLHLGASVGPGPR